MDVVACLVEVVLMSSRDWDVVKGDSLQRIVVGDGSKPLPDERCLPDELLPKEKSYGCEEVPLQEAPDALQGEA